MPFRRRVLIVEDDPLVGSLMTGALANEGLEARLARSGVEAKRQLDAFDPDVAIVDIDLGDGPNGIEVVQMLSAFRPEVAAILLSKHPDSASAGVRCSDIPEEVAYLRKSLVHDTKALIAAIDDAAAGRMASLRHDRQSMGWLDLLTRTQREILHMMALGLSNRAIARERGVSVSSVEQRVSEIFKAFGIPQDDTLVPRVEAIRRYVSVTGVPER